MLRQVEPVVKQGQQVNESHLRALMQRRAPGMSARSLCHQAGVSHSRLDWWLSPKVAERRPPKIDQCAELARIIGGGCTPEEVREAIALDQDPGAVLAPGLTVDERELIASYRCLSKAEQLQARRILAVLKTQ